jgi:leucyl aminopeptidase
VSTTLSIPDTPLHQVDADALVIAVHAGPDGPQPAPGTKDVDDALGGRLAATLATLGTTGEAGEVTKIATGGRLSAPLIVAVGIGADGGDAPIEPETLRRAAGAAVRAVGSPRGGG